MIGTRVAPPRARAIPSTPPCAMRRVSLAPIARSTFRVARASPARAHRAGILARAVAAAAVDRDDDGDDVDALLSRFDAVRETDDGIDVDAIDDETRAESETMEEANARGGGEAADADETVIQVKADATRRMWGISECPTSRWRR